MIDTVNDAEVKSNVEGLELYSDNYPFRLPLRVKDFESEAEFKKFIRNCEKIIRGSIEYKYWKDYIKDVIGVNTCMITEEKMDECTIEVHHHIPTLYLLVKSLIVAKIEKEEEFSTFDIALQAIELHFQNKIGYATLLKSMHEKFHNGYLTIPINLVKGDYKHFIDNYTQYLDSDDLDSINHRLTINQNNCTWSKDAYGG